MGIVLLYVVLTIISLFVGLTLGYAIIRLSDAYISIKKAHP